MLYDGNHFPNSKSWTRKMKCKSKSGTCLVCLETVSGTLLVMAPVDMFKIGFQ